MYKICLKYQFTNKTIVKSGYNYYIELKAKVINY